ncbi:unnamed protein product [Linum trigynum]|uniref:Uncharacterized protein n=1 Tax=Linum trigynum TaxID=586398 RepID=A0AAV2EXQ3_9ROSI
MGVVTLRRGAARSKSKAKKELLVTETQQRGIPNENRRKLQTIATKGLGPKKAGGRAERSDRKAKGDGRMPKEIVEHRTSIGEWSDEDPLGVAPKGSDGVDQPIGKDKADGESSGEDAQLFEVRRCGPNKPKEAQQKVVQPNRVSQVVKAFEKGLSMADPVLHVDMG